MQPLRFFLTFSIVMHIIMICSFHFIFFYRTIQFLYTSHRASNSTNFHCLYSKYSYWAVLDTFLVSWFRERTQFFSIWQHFKKSYLKWQARFWWTQWRSHRTYSLKQWPPIYHTKNSTWLRVQAILYSHSGCC